MMRKNVITLAVAAAFILPGAAFASTNNVFAPANNKDDSGPILYGYAQITGGQQWGTSTNGSPTGSNGWIIGANRIRLGVKGQAVPGVTYNIEAGWDNAALSGISGNPSTPKGNLLNNGLGNNGNASIINAWMNYAPVPFAQLKVGKFKLPVGNEYVSKAGNALPFVFRSMAQSLLPGRSLGAMIHANDVMGTGASYAVGFADDTSLDPYNAYYSGNNAAYYTGGGQGGFLNGSGNYIAFARLGYDFMGPLLKAEVSGSRMSLGAAPSAGLSKTAVYTWNAGIHGGLMGVHYAASYTNMTSGRSFGVGGYSNKGMLATDWNVGLGVNLHQMTLTPSWLDIEPAVRFDSFSINDHNGYDAKIDNTTVGLNYFVNPNNPHAAEVQLNYIIPTARQGNFGAGTMGGVFGANDAPINGAAYNTLMLQFQAGF
ncbi:porin [Acidithiobacillus thiooxidans]|uniref:porin n=1 Tax=Acidithiobacillus thiooxidans TaxID=930 RepID=UPI001D01469F|nr:porin [Acidithiobacillus thiooxidans]